MLRGFRHPGLCAVGRHPTPGLLAAAVLLLQVTGSAHASDDCTTAFEKWSKASTARMRMQKMQGAPETGGAVQQEACMPSESVRQGLLLGLAKARTACDEAPWLDQSAKQTKEMIDINASVIGSVTLCRTDDRPVRAIEPVPVAPRPAPRPRTCLEIAQVDAERYVLSNRKCSGSSVLVVVEKRGPSGQIECKGYTIARRLAVATLKDARPQINYECVLEQGNCTKTYVATIFPECDW